MKEYRLQCLWVYRGFLELQVYKPGGSSLSVTVGANVYQIWRQMWKYIYT
jgi:hypothetical protein